MNIKNICIAILLSGCTIVAAAQNSTNSPYSQYGLGELSSQASAAQRGMGGIGQGFRDSKMVNFLNPASYSAIDSLTFIFDAGITGRITNYKEGSNSKSGTTANFDYIMALFRIFKHCGMSVGMVPYTSMNYGYTTTSPTRLKDGSLNKNITNSHLYAGTGGFRQAYLGIAYAPVKYISFGANISYFWGDYSKTLTTTFGDGSTTDIKIYYATAKSWKLDLGLQYTQPVGKDNEFTLGGTYSFGHRISRDAYCSDNDSATCSLSIPSTVSVGAVWRHGKTWLVGADYNLGMYGKIDMPIYNDVDKTYKLTPGQLMDRHSISLGGQWCPDYRNRHYIQRMSYRLGVSYSTPYVKINGADGPKQLMVSLGFAFPIQNGYNNRSVLNVTGQWIHNSAKDMIRENSFCLTLGLCFNEQWFTKWKAE